MQTQCLLLFAAASLQLVTAQSSNSTDPLAPIIHGDVAWILISSALVFIMVPGLGLFYSGTHEAKNSMTMFVSVLLAFSVAIIEWSLLGYTLALSDNSDSKFIGNFRYGGLLNTIDTQNIQAPTIPNSLFAMYQMMFAGITPALFTGSVGGRMKMVPTMVFVLLWSIIVYNPIVYWVWSANGWLHNINVMDYAGGSVVHVSSGTTAIVLAIMLGQRVDYGQREYHKHNPTFVYVGTGLLWFGWMGFNGGSASASNPRAVDAAYASNLAAASGGLVWMMLEVLVEKSGFTTIGFCTGAVAGLATITPGAGFVQPGFGIIFGVLASIVCFYSVEFIKHLRIDDSLDVMGVHGVGGALGMVLTGLFAQHTITDVDAPGSTAGWVDHVWVQVPVQLAAIFAVGAWSIAWSIVLILFLERVCGLKMRCSKEEEIQGLDIADIKEPSRYTTRFSQPASALPFRKSVEVPGFVPHVPEDSASKVLSPKVGGGQVSAFDKLNGL
ncbi:hypothetical protein HDU98_001371 [Podochytrium sp. JEL0797]|nr:hypothetical protein HDU98_001371 [Podochytrium sp. JEL0797]